MSQLVEVRCFSTVEITLVISNTSNIFHRAIIVFRNENLIVLPERVWLSKEIFVELHTCLGHVEHLLVVDIV